MDIIEEHPPSLTRKSASKASGSGLDSVGQNANLSPPTTKQLAKRKSSTRLKRPQTAPVSSIPLPVLPVAINLEETCPLPLSVPASDPGSSQKLNQSIPHFEEPSSDTFTTSSSTNLDGNISA